MSSEGETVTATTNKAGAKRISISPESDATDENGEVVFTITATNKTGNARSRSRQEMRNRSVDNREGQEEVKLYPWSRYTGERQEVNRR